MGNRIWIAFFILICIISFTWSCKETASISSLNVHQKQTIDSLIQQSIEARNNAPNDITFLADSIIDLSQSIGFTEGEIQGFYQKGIGYFFQSEYSKSEEQCHFVLENLESYPSLDTRFSHKLSGSAYTLLGILKQRQGKYEEAISFQLKALEQFESIENWENIGNVYSNISENFRFLKDFEKAILYNKKAEEFFLKIDNPIHLTTVLQNRGNIFFDQKKYEDALNIFQTTLEKAKQTNDNGNIVNAINNIGTAYEKLGKFEIGLQNYLTALEIYQKRNDHWGQANTLGNISMIHLELNELDKAKTFSNNALTISENHGFLELEKFSAENLAKIYERSGEYKKSIKFQNQVQILQDSLYNQQKFETVNRLEKQFNEERTNRIIAQKDKDLAETKLQSQRFRNLATLLGIVFLAVLIGAWMFYQQAKFRKEKNKELVQKNNIIQNQNEDLASLVNAYEAQREKFIQLGNHKIQLDDIIYIRYQNRISTVFLKNQSTIEHRIQLSQLMAELNYKSHFLFSQINQNYIVHFKNVKIDFHDGADEKYYFVDYLPTDLGEGRNENFIKTRKRSGLNKNFEREYQRYLRLQKMLGEV